MSPGVRPRSTVRHALWLGGLLVVLGGLFGMHGLDNHGGAGLDAVAHAAGHSAMTAHHVEVEAVMPVALSGHGAPGHSGIDVGAAGACMAGLVLTLIAQALRAYGSRARPLLWPAARPRRAPGGRGRNPGSPSLIQLSIQRC